VAPLRAVQGGGEKAVWRLAFFSRLEERKGLKLFVRAVGAMQEAALAADARFEVFFVGSDARIDMRPSSQWLRAATGFWKCEQLSPPAAAALELSKS